MRSSPDRDPFISNDELRYIQSTVDVEKEDKKIVPWKALMTSGPVYAITVAQFSLNWSDNTMLTQMPTFLAGMFSITFLIMNNFCYCNIFIVDTYHVQRR